MARGGPAVFRRHPDGWGRAAVGARLAARRGEWRDLPAAAFAGAAIGVLAAAVGFAVIQMLNGC